MDNVNPISEEIKNALERHLQPTISTYGHEMVVRGWGGTNHDINTIYIKNTWKSHPLLVYDDLNLVAKGIHHILPPINRDSLIGSNIFNDKDYDKNVRFTWLMISDNYVIPKGKNEYMDSYVCEPTNFCNVAATENIKTYRYDGKDWVLIINKTDISHSPQPDTPDGSNSKYTHFKNKLIKNMKNNTLITYMKNNKNKLSKPQ